MNQQFALAGLFRAGSMLAVSALIVVAGPADAALISVDFGTTTVQNGVGSSPTTSGAESAATAANAGFGVANVWNGLQVGEYSGPATSNPSFSGLVDSSGAATGVGLQLTGSVKGFSGFNNNSTDTLRKDYLFFNSGNNPATTLSWVITGLVAGASYDFFAYGSNAGNSDWTMRVGAVDIGVAGFNGTAFFDDLIADASGTISGSLLPSGTYDRDTATFTYEVNWSGFQLLSNAVVVTPTPAPEPAGLALVGLALAGLVLTGRQRRGAGRA